MSLVHPFDLQARAELATYGLTALLDPARQGQMYFLGAWRSRPPRADHSLWDCGDGTGRHVDALTLARSMVRQGSPAATPNEGERQLQAWLVRFLGEEGLSWLPAEAWAEPWGKEVLLAHWRPGQKAAEISWAQRGTLMGLTSLYLRTADERYLAHLRHLVDGLEKIAIRHADGLYFPEAYYQLAGWGRTEPDLYVGLEEYNAVLVDPLVRLWQVSGYEPALRLAEGLFRFALKHTTDYNPDGSFRPVGLGQMEVAHFHTRTSFMLGALKLGAVLGKQEYMAWARQAYAEAQRWGTTFGWFPEGLGARHAELCCTTDMIELALLLGQHIDRRYYADAERYGRNHLLESQFLALEPLQEALDRLPPEAAVASREEHYSTDDHVAQRQVGVFASRPALNDAFHTDAAAMMQCCHAAATRALYDLWRYAIAEEPGHAAVHLRFSVETPMLRVVSHEPAEGRLDLTARLACELAVRLPEGETRAWLGRVSEGAPIQTLTAKEGYVSLTLGQGEEATLTYPLREWRECYEVGRGERLARCVGYWRGETLMCVDPPGTYLPLYDRPITLEPVIPTLPAAPPIAAL